MKSNPETRAETTKIYYGMNLPACAEMAVKFSDNLKSYSGNVGHEQSKGDPQERTKSLGIFPKDQGVGRRTFKKNKNRQMPTVLATAVDMV